MFLSAISSSESFPSSFVISVTTLGDHSASLTPSRIPPEQITSANFLKSKKKYRKKYNMQKIQNETTSETVVGFAEADLKKENTCASNTPRIEIGILMKTSKSGKESAIQQKKQITEVRKIFFYFWK